MGDDKRKFERFRAHITVDLHAGEMGVYLFKVTSNISRNGVFIDSEEFLEIGSAVDIIFALFDGSKTRAAAQVVVKGRVVRVQKEKQDGIGPGMGFEFQDLDEDDWELIEIAAAALSEQSPLDMVVVSAEADARIKKELEVLRRHQEAMKKEAAKYLDEVRDKS